MVGAYKEGKASAHLAAIARGPVTIFKPSNRLHAKVTVSTRQNLKQPSLNFEAFIPV